MVDLLEIEQTLDGLNRLLPLFIIVETDIDLVERVQVVVVLDEVRKGRTGTRLQRDCGETVFKKHLVCREAVFLTLCYNDGRTRTRIEAVLPEHPCVFEGTHTTLITFV